MINIQIADFCSDLINDENLIILLARNNYENTDFSQDLLLIDDLASAIPMGIKDRYDDTIECESLVTYYNQIFTFDFYGDNAYANAHKFVALLRSEKALWHSKTYNIQALMPRSLTDLKALTGTQQLNRYQIEVTVKYYVETIIETLRIDTINYEISLVEE